MPTIGLAVGRGTGTQIAAVFEQVLGAIADRYGADAEIIRSPRVYHSYFSLKAECAGEPGGGVERIRALTQQDAVHYEQFCRELAGRGVPAVFRTAINAQSLYLEGRDLVNPTATIRAAAAIAEEHAGCRGAVQATERALASLADLGIRTPDLGGHASTTAVVDALLDALAPGGPVARAAADPALAGGS